MSRVELIAEVSTNHGGDLKIAKEFIRRYADAGADFIKFQSYQTATLQPGDPQFAWLQQSELTDHAHGELMGTCANAGVQFLTTVFHVSRVPFLQSLGLSALKIGSGEAQQPALLAAVSGYPRVFVSTGLEGRQRAWGSPFEALLCVTRYPAPTGFASALVTRPYGAGLVGYSDHTIGLDVAQSAICAGARVIEKHVCLPKQARPHQPWEATVADFAALRAFADHNPELYQDRWQWTPRTVSASV